MSALKQYVNESRDSTQFGAGKMRYTPPQRLVIESKSDSRIYTSKSGPSVPLDIPVYDALEDSTQNMTEVSEKNLEQVVPKDLNGNDRFTVARNPFKQDPIMVHPVYAKGSVQLPGCAPNVRYQPSRDRHLVREKMSSLQKQQQSVDHVADYTEPRLSGVKNERSVAKPVVGRMKPMIEPATHTDNLKFVPLGSEKSTSGLRGLSNNRMFNNLSISKVHEQQFDKHPIRRDLRQEALNKKREAFKQKEAERKQKEEDTMKRLLAVKRQMA